MTHTIYKYVLSVDDRITIPMPQGAQILSVQSVNDQIAVWVRVKPDAPVVNRGFAIHGTGDDLPKSTMEADYVGTAVTLSGRLVWHVFDLGEV